MGAAIGGDAFLDSAVEIEREQRDLGIGAKTIVHEWRGGKIMWSWAVQGLQEKTLGCGPETWRKPWPSRN